MGKANIFYMVPDINKPLGGIKQLYRHVDVLNENGFSAWAVHWQRGFRCTWFENNTRTIDWLKAVYFAESGMMDFCVIPENFGPKVTQDISITQNLRRLKKVIFNQNCYYAFGGYTHNKDDLSSPYSDENTVATMVVSEDNLEYMSHVFPKHKFIRIHNGINQSRFSFGTNKKKQIAFQLKKNPKQVTQVINALKFRGVLKEFDIVPIHNKTEAQVAEILKDSLIYLSFSYPEGLGLSSAEAMLCGCIVVGYHGMGGREYFNSDYCYPVPFGDIMTFVKTVEKVIDIYRNNPLELQQKAESAAVFVREKYTTQRETADIVGFWDELCRK